MNLFDFFSGRGGRQTSGKNNRRNKPVTDTRLCPGCPATVVPNQLELPKMRLPDVPKNTSTGDTKIVSVVNMGDYKKNHKPGPDTLF